MSNSMAQLLARMRNGPVTLGWGAVAAYSRSRLNNLLEQQYLARLEDNSYLPPFTQKLASDTLGDSIELQRVMFGAPLLSFSNASISGSKAILRLNLVSGNVINGGRLIGSTLITEADGLWVELEVDLETVTGEVDPYGRVTLNLAHAAQVTSNLFEHDANLNRSVATALQSWMRALPARHAVFELGTVDFSGYDPLAPTRFIIRTQAAPGAKVRAALNYGDGAVLVFIQLRDQPLAGSPPDNTFPYLIPDGDFSATLVLNKDLLAHASDQGLELLARLLFPQLNAFIKKEDHTPLDRALFGNIDPTLSHYTLEPALSGVIAAGGSLQFTLRDGSGQPVSGNTTWHAVSPQSHTAAGHGSISGAGLYRAPQAAEMGREVVTVIVTAEHQKAGLTYRAAARLQVIVEALLLTPSAKAYRPEQEELDVWNAGIGNTTFELLEPRLGELAALSVNRARFVPGPQVRRRLLAVQQVQASAGEQFNAALIMVNGQPLVHLDPPLVPSMSHGGTTQLSDANRIMPNQPRRWRVLAGNGSVSASGLFQASAQRQMQSNVVACEVVHNGVVFAAGYSVLKQTSLETVESWTSLNRFTLTVGKNPDGTKGIVGSSGFQQLEVEITVETQAVDGKDYKLSVDEIASLRLFDRSGQAITLLSDSEEGIGQSEQNTWRISRVKNRFVLANESDPIAVAQMAPVPQGAEDRTIRQSFYLHRRGTSGSQVFYAGFQKDTDEWFYSNATDHRNATIEVLVRTPEPFKAQDYSLIRKRVAGGGGDEGLSDPEHPDFDLKPVTDDYWSLAYSAGTLYTAEFVKVSESDNDSDVNTSMVRWESPYGNEIYHSYTGYIFQNHGQEEPKTVSFDNGLGQVLGRADFSRLVASQYQPGLLVIVNCRDRNRQLKDAEKTAAYKKLTKPLRIRLRDAKGNEHLVQIDYLPEDTVGSRNVLVHTVPSRPSGQGITVRLGNREEGAQS